jgi:queuine tRNA-ribosyltransferase catalytic subunit
MGVGYAVDLVVCVALGVDMFDCVFPTRTARFGVALVNSGSLRLKNKEYADQLIPVEDKSICKCSTCENYSRAILHMMFKENNPLACQLLTTHNVAYMMRLMRTMRQAILDGEDAYIAFINAFLVAQYPNHDTPLWVISALQEAGITIATDMYLNSK